MNARDQFVSARRADWQELASLLSYRGALYRQAPSVISRVASLYRAICADLMRARSLGCGPDIVSHLDALTAQAHNALYVPRPQRVSTFLSLVFLEFPRTLRRNWRLFLFANLLFWLPFAGGLLASMQTLDFASKVLPTATLEQMAESYSNGFADGRDVGTDTMMAGFYVRNNVGIAFRCFATGILAGLGSIFFLVYNGLITGTMVGHVIRAGAGTNILTFVVSHSPFELTAIVISGAAGMQMGFALVVTRGLTRLASLRREARSLTAQILGAGVMLLVAALVEGFWSPSALPPRAKLAFGCAMTLLVAAFLSLAGRRRLRALERP